ncbi:hypothetical protein ACLOJK_012975 [Asimina triloba]
MRSRQFWDGLDLVVVMGSLDCPIQGPAAAVDKADGLGRNRWPDNAEEENDRGHRCCGAHRRRQ